MFLTRIVVWVSSFHCLYPLAAPSALPFLLTVLIFNSFCKVGTLRPYVYSYLHHHRRYNLSYFVMFVTFSGVRRASYWKARLVVRIIKQPSSKDTSLRRLNMKKRRGHNTS
uniref:Expressed protein n=1 Tax=Echinococcus granulosus TaxID=6210 RepID=A0A068WIQ6_ECHGR|nr:expressed protein [Echinococcus granulosus]